MNIMAFLTPHNGLEFTFFMLIFGILIVHIAVIMIVAHEKNWQNKWQRESLELDTEHGSISDISNTVATTSEKLADIMPGTILVIGLLGTFLGIGLALDKASTILEGINQAGGMDKAMGDLMGMMQGLGAKFKTSTWGIIAYLVFKIFTSAYKFEDRRIHWCLQKMKVQLDARRKQDIDLQKELNAQFLKAINLMGSKISDVLEKKFNENINATRQVSSKIEIQSTKQIELLTTLQGNVVSFVNVFKKAHANFNEQMSQIKAILNKLDQTILNSTEQMSAKIQEQSNQQIESINNLNQSFANVANSNKNMLEKLLGSISKIDDSAVQMKSASLKLENTVGMFDDKITFVLNDLKSELTSTINTMSNDFNDIAERLNNATTGISTAVETMNDSFITNLESMSSSLKQITDSMKNSVDSMSSQINQTLTTVMDSIKQGDKIQKQNLATFNSVADNLSANVESISNDLKNPIEELKRALVPVSELQIKLSVMGENLKGVVDSLNTVVAEMTKPKSTTSKIFSKGS